MDDKVYCEVCGAECTETFVVYFGVTTCSMICRSKRADDWKPYFLSMWTIYLGDEAGTTFTIQRAVHRPTRTVEYNFYLNDAPVTPLVRAEFLVLKRFYLALAAAAQSRVRTSHEFLDPQYS